MEQIFLYEAVPWDDFRQTELARITYYSETDQWEIYYRHLEKSFPRDIFGMSNDEQKRELEELYDSLNK